MGDPSNRRYHPDMPVDRYRYCCEFLLNTGIEKTVRKMEIGKGLRALSLGWYEEGVLVFFCRTLLPKVLKMKWVQDLFYFGINLRFRGYRLRLPLYLYEL
jgi:hypothetical protein